MHMEVAGSVKKERAVGAKVKRERIDEQKADVESPQKESMEMDDLWLQLKLEINEEMEQQMRLSSVDTGDMHGVRIKEEFADKPHQDLKSFQSQFLNSEADKVMERAQQQSSKAAQGRSIVQPGHTPVARRRRLTRHDWPNNHQAEMASSVKKEPAVGLKIKRERIEQEGSMESPQKELIQTDDLWLQAVHKEINERCSVEPTSPTSAAEAARKALAGECTAPRRALKSSSFDTEEAARSDDQEESLQERPRPQSWQQDHSQEELESSFQEAVAWRKKQEKERAKAKKAKAPPVKKKGKKVKGRLVKKQRK
eukprot:Skav235788  [mRNA]  locus=scaffold1267:2217:5466:+ [translate_table: standard]